MAPPEKKDNRAEGSRQTAARKVQSRRAEAFTVRRNGTTLSMVAAALAIVGLATLTTCSSAGRDASITSRVRTVLQADRVVDASAIHVTTERGVVTLDGSVAGEDAHRKALDLAQSVDGVRLVRDRLAVTPPPPQPAEAAPQSPSFGDAPADLGGMMVEERTRERRPSDQPGGNYGLMAAVVGSENDVALEPGRTEAAVEPAALREPAPERPAVDGAGARGEEAVATSLPPSQALLGAADDDAATTARVREALVELGSRVQVLTRAGVVILSGAVDTERERSEAVRLARETRGVARVEDRLIVLES
jgi:hyperosmotically inducible protein